MIADIGRLTVGEGFALLVGSIVLLNVLGVGCVVVAAVRRDRRRAARRDQRVRWRETWR